MPVPAGLGNAGTLRSLKQPQFPAPARCVSNNAKVSGGRDRSQRKDSGSGTPQPPNRREA